MTVVLVVLVTFLGVFTQTLTGFGISMVMMALLVPTVGLGLSAPLVAILGTILEIVLLIYYRDAIAWQTVKQLVLGSLIGVPIGLWGIAWLDERIMLFILGVVLIGYGLYALFEFTLPELSRPGLGYLFGFIAGILGGAYNTLGPPVIIYGNCRRWPPRQFKVNMQAFFILASLFIAIGHAVNGNVTREVLTHVLFAMPVLLLAIVIGIRFDEWLNPHRFRQLVLVVLIILGVRLTLTAM